MLFRSLQIRRKAKEGELGAVETVYLGGGTPSHVGLAGLSMLCLLYTSRNRYGHPAQDTLDRLEAAGARVFRTDEQGDVSCKLTADRIEVDTLR